MNILKHCVCFTVLPCSDPGTPLHGTRSGDDFHVGRQVSYHCDEGYRLDGDEIATCMSNRTWSKDVPRCDGINFLY